jgi:hypothetical protein
MSDMLKTATTAVKLVVAGVGGVGPKSTNVAFVTRDGVREWAWVGNPLAVSLRAGMVLLVEQVQPANKVQTTYINSEGVEVELKVPKRQLFLGGSITVEAPEQTPLLPVTFVVTDEAIKFANAVDAKVSTVDASLIADQPF